MLKSRFAIISRHTLEVLCGISFCSPAGGKEGLQALLGALLVAVARRHGLGQVSEAMPELLALEPWPPLF